MRLACAVLALVCCLLVIRYDSRVDRAIVQVIYPPPWSITWLVTVIYQAGSLGVVIVLAALALIARRWLMARDIALSAAGAAAVSGMLIAVLGSRGGRSAGVVIGGYDLSFPVLRIALFMAVAVRLVFGSPLGLPSADDVRLLLQEIGIGASNVHPVPRQVWGVARYQATETRPDGSPPAGGSGSRSMAGMRPTPGCLPRRAGFCCTGTPGRPSRLPGCSRSNGRLT